MQDQVSWHSLSIDAAAEKLSSDGQNGISESQARQRLGEVGPNILTGKEKRSLATMLLDQFRNFLVLILLAAAIVSVVLGLARGETESLTDAAVIGAILVLNAVLGVVHERKAGEAMEALKKMTVPSVEVIRGGRQMEMSSEQVVPGDLVILREGDFIPADIRLTVAENLKVDEASLTGESLPVEKTTDQLDGSLPLPDRLNMAYAGTHVAYGRGRGLVVATGMKREIGKIAGFLGEQAEADTPLQRNLGKLGRLLGIVALVICAGIFALQVVQASLAGENLVDAVVESFKIAVSLAVAAIPEGLPATVTIVLAIGTYRMSRRQAIVRRLPAVETLGSASFICTDKTGTLTQNRMTVRQSLQAAELLGQQASEQADELLLACAVLCNDSHVAGSGEQAQRLGDPTELALVDLAAERGTDVEQFRQRHARLDELPFDSGRKMMSTLNDTPTGRRQFTKGGPDVLLEHCSRYVGPDAQDRPLTDQQRRQIVQRLDEMAGEALRVLAFAYRDAAGKDELAPGDEDDLVFCGLMGMIDPPRDEARQALAHADAAGVQTIMITGDNVVTARAIAADLGMLREGDESVTGTELEQVADDELRRRVEHIRVFARVWPEQKLRIVKALQENGQIVAMTGDGVNDAPALKRADIGVAMGITGTDVAKETSDIILADDNFATIVAAIEQGRVIFDNIRKFVIYLLSCNLGEIIAILSPILMGLRSPLAPVQILLVNLVTDGLPALALGMDAPEPDVMRRRPRKSGTGILERYDLAVIGYTALFIGAAVTGSFLCGLWMTNDWAGEHRTAMTMAFVTLGIAELWRAYSSRSRRLNFWRIDPRTNVRLLGAMALSAAVVLSTVLVAPLRHIFNNVPLNAAMWSVALAWSLLPMAAYEAWKLVRHATATAAKPADNQ